MCPVLEDHLLENQFCGVPGNAILDAVVTVRDTIAYAESKKMPLCVLSLDFKNAFDRISHKYVFQILKCYGIGNPFINSIKRAPHRLFNSMTIYMEPSQSIVLFVRDAQ
jgi:hypothetical protein